MVSHHWAAVVTATPGFFAAFYQLHSPLQWKCMRWQGNLRGFPRGALVLFHAAVYHWADWD